MHTIYRQIKTCDYAVGFVTNDYQEDVVTGIPSLFEAAMVCNFLNGGGMFGATAWDEIKELINKNA